jgi:hypothetical protein
MQDEIDPELKRLTEIFGREEVDEAAPFEPDAKLLEEIKDWVRFDAENEPARIEAAAAQSRIFDEWLEGLLAESEPSDSATDGEISAELMEEIKDWLQADQISQAEADARAARELDELVERFRNESDL